MPAAAAGIAFAADVSAGIKLGVSAFDYDKSNDSVKALTLKHHNADYESPISFSISGEKAGATYHLCEGKSEPGANTDIQSSKWNIWFKPIDILTVNIGSWDTNLNVETIDWNTYSGIGSAGVTFSLAPVDGLSFDLTFAPDWNYNSWFSKVGSADATIAELGMKVAYNADGIGTISAMFDAKNSFHNLGFGVGYKNTFGPATIFVNALGFTGDDKFAKVRVEAYAEIPVDALKIQAFVAGGYNMEAYDPKNPWDFAYFAGDDKAFVGAKAKIAYSIGAATPYLYLKDENFLADDFSMVIKPGVAFSVGECSIDAALEFTAQENIKIGVPIGFSMSF